MAREVLLNVKYYMGYADLTGQSNEIQFDDDMEEKECTTFGSGSAKEYVGGVETCAIASKGFLDSAETVVADKYFWDNRRVTEAHSILPIGATVGYPAYLTKAIRLKAALGGQVGEVQGWSAGSAGSYPMARGAVLLNPATPITADGNGTAVQGLAVGAGQRLYAALHVLSVAGTNTPELSVTVQSDSANTFAATPETRLTFTTFTAVGSEMQRTAVGAHTDTWYRAQIDVDDNGGSGMSFLALLTLGIA